MLGNKSVLDNQTIVIAGLIVGGIIAYLFLYQQNARRLTDPDLQRINDLEKELAELQQKVINLERLNDLVITRNGELTKKLERTSDELNMIDAENKMLRRRFNEMGINDK